MELQQEIEQSAAIHIAESCARGCRCSWSEANRGYIGERRIKALRRKDRHGKHSPAARVDSVRGASGLHVDDVTRIASVSLRDSRRPPRLFDSRRLAERNKNGLRFDPDVGLLGEFQEGREDDPPAL